MWLSLIVATLPAAMPPADAPTIGELAREADAVVAVRVVDTFYAPTGSGTVTGDAQVEVLARYKGDSDIDTLLIHEDGEPASACHLPPRLAFTERFLLFLRRNPGGSWARIACPMRILVTEVGQFALLYPLAQARLDEGITVRELRYADRSAWVPEAYLSTAAEADTMRETFFAEDREEGLIYTRGIMMRELFVILRGE
jgi:hypothetical protein